MSEPISIRPLAVNDIDQVLELMRVSLGETAVSRRTKDHFTWKHLENPFGRSMMLVATSRNQIVGFRAFLRWEMTTPTNDLIICARPVDTATHPRFQRQGIFRELTLRAVEIARDESIDLIFNTPNAQSGAGYRSMGWTEVGKIRIQARPTRRLLGKSDEGEPAVNGRVQKIDNISSIRFSDREPQGLRTRRGIEYLKWRYEDNPSASYLAAGDQNGAAVLRPNTRKGRRELVISDLAGSDLDGALSMVRSLSRGSDYLVASFPIGSPERRAVLGAGLYRVPWLSALALHAYPLRDLPIDPTVLNNWDITLGDLELL